MAVAIVQITMMIATTKSASAIPSISCSMTPLSAHDTRPPRSVSALTSAARESMRPRRGLDRRAALLPRLRGQLAGQIDRTNRSNTDGRHRPEHGRMAPRLRVEPGDKLYLPPEERIHVW